MRNRLLAGATLAAALSAGCGSGPGEPASPAPGAILAAPAPSASFVTSPLASESTSYTNEMQQDNLRAQGDKLGLHGFTIPGAQNDEPRRPISYEEGLERTREFAAEFESQRHAIDHEKEKSVALPGETPSLLPAQKEGSPLEAGPKDPENK